MKIIYLGLIVLILAGVYLILDKKYDIRGRREEAEREELKALIDQLKELLTGAFRLAASYRKTQKKEENQAFRRAFEALLTFQEKEQLPEEVREVLDLDEVTQTRELKAFFEEQDAVYTQITQLCDRISDCCKKHEEELKKLKKKVELSAALKKAKGEVAAFDLEVKNKRKEATDKCQLLKEEREKQAELEENLGCLQSLKEHRFTCNLVISFLDEDCIRARDRSWFWLLDDTMVMRAGSTIGEYFHEKTGIVFFPYRTEDEEGRTVDGVLAAAGQPFEVREAVQSEDAVIRDTQAVLYRGRTYRMELAGTGSVFIKVIR